LANASTSTATRFANAPAVSAAGAHGRTTPLGGGPYHDAGDIGAEHASRRHAARSRIIEITTVERNMMCGNDDLPRSRHGYADLSRAHAGLGLRISDHRAYRHVAKPATGSGVRRTGGKGHGAAAQSRRT
jgi:hypothetical protein